MVGWHHPLDGYEFEQALGVGDGQGGLTGYSHGVPKSQTRLSNVAKATKCWGSSVNHNVRCMGEKKKTPVVSLINHTQTLTDTLLLRSGISGQHTGCPIKKQPLKAFTHPERNASWNCLLVQWLRVCPLLQGTQMWSPVREEAGAQGNWAHVLESLWSTRADATTREEPPLAATRESPLATTRNRCSRKEKCKSHVSC